MKEERREAMTPFIPCFPNRRQSADRPLNQRKPAPVHLVVRVEEQAVVTFMIVLHIREQLSELMP